MNVRPNALLRRVRGLPVHLQDLAEHLQRLSSRVRESVVDAAGQTVAAVVKDLLNRAWSGQSILTPASDVRQSIDPYAWSSGEPDPWPVERSNWERAHSLRDANPVVEPGISKPLAGLAALALHAGGWWLRGRGHWFGIIGLGMLVSSFTLIGGRAALNGLGLFETAGELFALDHLLKSGGRALDEI